MNGMLVKKRILAESLTVDGIGIDRNVVQLNVAVGLASVALAAASERAFQSADGIWTEAETEDDVHPNGNAYDAVHLYHQVR